MRLISCEKCGVIFCYDTINVPSKRYSPDLKTTFYPWVPCAVCKNPIELSTARDSGPYDQDSCYDIDNEISDAVWKSEESL